MIRTRYATPAAVTHIAPGVPAVRDVGGSAARGDGSPARTIVLTPLHHGAATTGTGKPTRAGSRYRLWPGHERR